MSEKRFKYIIVGGGLAGISAAGGIREVDGNSEILMIGAEPHLPYDRPPLSKKLWFGTKTVEQIFVHDRGWFDKNRVTPALGTRVMALDAGKKVLTDQHGDLYRFDKLMLATGGVPRRLPLPGGDLPEICYYRYLDDYLSLRVQAVGGKSAIVVGGGFIGSEMAAALNINKVDVTMIFPEKVIAERVMPGYLGRHVQQHFIERGVTVLNEDQPIRFEKACGQIVMTTARGREVKADIALAGIGIEADQRLAKAAGLKVGNGIVVDETARTSAPDIYAAGDNAFFPYRALGRAMRLEHWDHAINHGKCAGRNMAGAGEPYTHMPYFFSDLFEFGYEAVGDIDPALETSATWQKENEEGTIYFLKDGRVRGAMMCNVWDKVPEAREMILRGEAITPPQPPRETRGGGGAMSIADEKCVRPALGDKPLALEAARSLAREIPGWTLGPDSIEREFRLTDFGRAVEFINQVAGIAAEQDHHPDIFNSYNVVRLKLSTHKIGGLSRNDFIVAAKIDRLAAGVK